MSLKEIIIEEIKEHGPISFRDYMEMCLYHPSYGYYSTGNSKVGPRGDFYTSPALGSLFGTLIANQLEEMWVLMGRKNFVIVEYGAGTGLLCHDILIAISKKSEFSQNIQYFIIEKNNSAGWSYPDENVTRIRSISEIPPFEGCILSNELIDNFSVHRVINQDSLVEICVNYESGQFREMMLPADQKFSNYFSELGVSLPRGFNAEVNLEAIDWILEISSRLQRGFVLTIDYGFASRELYDTSRASGTLMCYHNHRINSSLYENIGAQDITAHINFSALHHWGKKHELSLSGFTTQSMFLMGLGVSREATIDPACAGSPLMLRTLLIDMGKRMKVLVQQKNVDVPTLAGMRFPMQL